MLEHLEVKQRTELVDTALAMEKPVFKAGLISALAQGLQFLGRSQRNTFVEEVLKMNGENSGLALCGLGNGMGCLSAHQRTELFNKTLAVLPMEVRAEAIIGMAGGLGFLTAGERVGFVDAVVTLPHSVKRSEAISAIGAELAFLQEDQREQLFEAALALADSLEQANALAGLAQGQPCVNP